MRTTTEAARRLGRLAFLAGVPCAPVLDVHFATLRDRAANRVERMAIMRAWLAGWHAANAADLTDEEV